MMKSEITYSNRQVRTQEDLFGPGDPDALLVGGTNQEDPYGYASVKADNPEFAGRTTDIVDNSLEGEEIQIDLEDEGDLDTEVLGTITAVTFEQEGRFTGDGTLLVYVVATFN